MIKRMQTRVTLIGLSLLPAVRALAADTLTFDTTEPTGASIVIANPHSTATSTNRGSFGERDTFTTVFPIEATAPGDRGQTFTMPTNPTGDTWDLNTLTLRADANPDGSGVSQNLSTSTNTMKLWLFQWNPSDNANSGTNWAAGNGLSDGDPFSGTGITNFLVNGEQFDVTHSFSGDFMHFNLASSGVKLSNNTAYAFIVSFESATTGIKLDSIRDDTAPTGEVYALGAFLRVDNTTQSINSGPGDDLVFYVDATPSPEPASLALFGIGPMLMLSKRTRRPAYQTCPSACRAIKQLY